MAVLTAPRRLYELWRYIFPAKPPSYLERLEAYSKAEEARRNARNAFLDALDRGDTRDQKTTHERFVAATAECLRLSL